MPLTGPSILLYEKKNKIVIMTLNRPERGNSLSHEMFDRLDEAWRRFDSDEDAWVAIITGAGEKAFCTGMDIVDFDNKEMRKMAQHPHAFFRRQLWKPMIAAINGHAIAGGFNLVHRCDIRIAAEHAELGVSEAALNAPAGWVCNLTRQILLGHALEIVLWADKRITAQRGYEIGFINRVVPGDGLMEEALAWAERMLYMGPQAVRNLKRILYEGYYVPEQIFLPFAYGLEGNEIGTQDTEEGFSAFFEKRKPRFKNR
jgi:enoyl-CoA hydratase/carnithine racemase